MEAKAQQLGVSYAEMEQRSFAGASLKEYVTPQQLADALGRDVEAVLEAREALRAMRPASLDRPAQAAEDEDDMPLQRIGDVDPAYERRRRPSRSAGSSRTSPSASGASSPCASRAT